MISGTTIALIILAPTVAFLLIRYFYLKQDVDFTLNQIRLLFDAAAKGRIYLRCLECDRRLTEGDLAHLYINSSKETKGFICENCYLKIQANENDGVYNYDGTMGVAKPLNFGSKEKEKDNGNN